jgi:hypothetical protein|tara:strand:- start:227 stop:421 length:195 start_codon:yes stop_codon:yes gene_type:complete
MNILTSDRGHADLMHDNTVIVKCEKVCNLVFKKFLDHQKYRSTKLYPEGPVKQMGLDKLTGKIK